MSPMMPPTLADLPGWDLGRDIATYAERDAILFALAVGARADELEWVYEQRLRVMPTFALTLGLWAVRAAGATGAYDPVKTLHVGQELVVHRSLPPAAEIAMSAAVRAVWDKGSSALVEILVDSEFFAATYTVFVPGGGGFGGDRGPSSRASEPEQKPRYETIVSTTLEQPALYRLTGDLHPVHIDPDVARANGFVRPILHGLCTLACVTRAVASATDRDLGSLTSLSTRFTAPVYPGEDVAVAIWDAERGFRFRASGFGGPVLSGGNVEFSASAE